MNDVVVYEEPAEPSKSRSLASARFVPQEALDLQGAQRGDFWLGRTLNNEAFGWNEDTNLLTCAGPGTGKGVSSVIPNLLTHPGTVIVIDPKGDLATETAQYRRDVLGHKVIVLDPTRTANVPDDLRGSYNPFDALRLDDPYVATAAQVIASAIVTPNPKSSDPFWDATALDLVQSCILYMLARYKSENRTLMKLLDTVAFGDRDSWEEYVTQETAENPDFNPSLKDSFDFFVHMLEQTEEFGGSVRQTAAKLARAPENTRESILATAASHMDFMKAPELAEVLKAATDPSRTFRLDELRRQDRPLTVYLCLPVDMMPRQGPWFRIILGQITQYLERRSNSFNKNTDYPVLLMMDEFAQLGRIASMTNTLTYARSSGLRLWLIVQDLNQLKTHYPTEWETILGACGIKQFFGVNDYFTAEYISKLVGDQEVDVPSISMNESQTESEGENEATSRNIGRSTQEGRNWNVSQSTNKSKSRGLAMARGRSTTAGQSTSHGTSSGKNEGIGVSLNHQAKGVGRDLHTDRTTGGATNTNYGVNSGRSDSVTDSTSTTDSLTYTESDTVTEGSSESESEGGSITEGFNESKGITQGTNRNYSKGVTYGLTISKQARRLLRPEEVMTSFTKHNFAQLAHIQGYGGLILSRTPYFADPTLRNCLDNMALPWDEEGRIS